MIAFTAHFGAGFYWFAAYCLFSLATQQFTFRVAAKTQNVPDDAGAGRYTL